MEANFRKFEQMDMKRLIIKMALPAMISMIVQALYNIVDSIFVAMISEEALTALSLAFPLQMIIISIFAGLGVGINSYMSRMLGAKNRDEAINTAEHGIILGLLISLGIAVLGFIVPAPFFRMFTDDPVILDHAVRYIRIVMVFSFASILTEITMNILRTTGDMIASMKIQLLGALSNIVLDPILIFGLLFVPAMGVTGAAVATVGGQFIAMVYAFFLLRRNKAGIRLKLSSFRFKAQIIKEIFKVATPAILMMLLNSFMIIGINMILAGFTATSVAVFGIYFKLQSFIYMPVFGLTQGMMPVVGYNFGARKLDRVASALKVTNIYAFLIMAMGTFIFFAFPRPLLFLFNSSEEMYAMGVVCLRIISAGFIFSGGVIVYSSYFQAIGTAVYSLVITLCRQIFILLPLAFALSRMIGVAGVWTAFPVSEGLSLIMSLLFLYRSRACCSDKNQLRRAA